MCSHEIVPSSSTPVSQAPDRNELVFRADTAVVAHSFNYDDRPEAHQQPLHLAEIEALILNGGKALERPPGRLVHFLHRVAATMRDHGQRVAKLQHDVEMIRSQRTAAGHPMARAVQALSELDEVQQRQLLDEGYLLELAKLSKAREDAEMVSAGAQNETNRVRHALGTLLEDPEVPSEVKQYVRVALNRIGYTY
jgi:hypothetical protein